MANDLQEYTVEELVKQKIIEKPLDGNHGGIHPKGDDFVNEGIPFIMASDLSNGRINKESCKFITMIQAKTLKKGFAKTGDVLLSHKATIGRTAIVGELKYDFLVLTPQVTYYRVKNPAKLNNRYLKYYFDSNIFQDILNNWAGGGSTRAYLGITAQLKLPVIVPEITTQKAIAYILGSLDDRIELNRQMNETLEAMAQALFKSWFVDFDPVIDNALANGKEIPEELSQKARARAALGDKRRPLPEEIRALFPDEFAYSDKLGWIPKGWDVKSINQILKTVSETYPLKSVEKVVFLNTGDILDGQFLHHNYSNVDSLPGQAKKSIMKDDILYSEIRPINRRFAYVHFDSQEYVVSTKLMVLRATSNIKSIFAYLILKQQSIIDYLQMMAESRSGTFPQITFEVLSTINIALPDKHTIVEYFTDNIVERFFEKSINNNNNSKHLSTLRDTLLPRLLSGELRILDAEKLIERVDG